MGFFQKMCRQILYQMYIKCCIREQKSERLPEKLEGRQLSKKKKKSFWFSSLTFTNMKK